MKFPGGTFENGGFTRQQMEEAVKAERERCAQLCEEYASRRGSPVGWLIDLASDIRDGI